jgi:hypothetical protein
LSKTDRIQFKYCWIDRTDYGCISTFNDGTFVKSCPHPELPHYAVVSHRMGSGDDLHEYAAIHDFCHHWTHEYLFSEPSPSLWGVAHRQPVPDRAAAYEEAVVMTFQRWLKTNERPIIAGVDWDDMKHKALKLLRNWECR